MTTPPPTRRRRRWPRRLARGLAWLGLVLLILWAMLTLPAAWRVHRLLAERDALLAELDRNEPGWRWDDLVPAKVPDEKNGAHKVLEIARLIPEDWLQIPEAIGDAQPRNHRNPRARYTKEFLTALENCLEGVKPARDQLQELMGLTTGDYGWDHNADSDKGGVFMATGDAKGAPRSNDAYRTFRLLEREFEWCIGTGQGDRAVQRLRALIGFARTWNRHPTISTGGAGYRSKFYIVLGEKLKRLLAQAEANPEALRQLSHDLEALKPDLHDPWHLASEKAMLNKFMEQGLSGLLDDEFSDDDGRDRSTPENATSWLESRLRKLWVNKRSQREVMLRQQMALLHFLRDAGGASADLKKACEYYSNLLEGPQGEYQERNGQWFNIYIYPRWKKISSDLSDLDERISMFRVAIAFEIYRLEHGRWPGDFIDLKSLRDAPTLLPAFPPPQGIKRLPDGLVLYWGEPKDPNNIQVLDLLDEEGYVRGYAPDRGIRLWNPDKRRSGK